MHIGHGKCPEAFKPDYLSFLFMPEGIGGEFIHFHRQGIVRDMHVPHDREHPETGGEPEHHVPVPALEPVLALAEFIGMLKNRTVAEVVHDRSFDRCCPIGEDRY